MSWHQWPMCSQCAGLPPPSQAPKSFEINEHRSKSMIYYLLGSGANLGAHALAFTMLLSITSQQTGVFTMVVV